MKNHNLSLIFLITLVFITTLDLQAQQYPLLSPDGQLKAVVSVEKNITIAAFYQGKSLFTAKDLKINEAGNASVFENLKVLNQQRNKIYNQYNPVVKTKSATVVENCNQLVLEFKGYNLECRVYDEGIAYRFIGETEKNITITGENMDLEFSPETMIYYPEEKSFFSHNERYYQHLALKDIKAESFCSLPMLAVPNGINVLVSESDLDNYAGMWLARNDSGFNAIFPDYPKTTELVSDRDEPVRTTEPYMVKTSANRDFPWRIFAVAEKDADLLTNELVWMLSDKNEIEDPSWIKPGKVAWDWWNYLNIYGVDFEAGVNTQTYKYFIDFAAEYGIEYIILDEGWYKLGDLMAVVPEVDMEELARYSREKGVGLILWVIWKTLDDQLDEALDQFEKWGVKGIKVDFMQRDDQWMVNYYERISREAAKHKMLVDFHGSYKPAGLHRKYPNVLTREGVCGLEQSKWGTWQTPEHNLILPFIRMVPGPMDYTPGAMLNAAKGNFKGIYNQPMSMGTRCHQLAMYVIYESPLQMLCDNPSNYQREPEIMEFLAPVPTVWDDTKILDAKIGDYVVTARRSGKEWYIGAMTDWDKRLLEIDLDFLEKGKNYKAIIYKDGKNAHRHGSDYKKYEQKVDATSSLIIELASGGGWVARIVEE